MNIEAVILARGGSKGIPKKNIIDLNGKPLISYTIEAAKNSNVDSFWVSTDCPEIAEVSLEYGAGIVQRPKEISGDHSKSDEALLHFAQEHTDFDILVFIQPTSPLLTAQDIDLGIEMMNSYDSVFSAYKEHWIPRWNLDKTPHGWNVQNRPMRQYQPEKWVENGAFYITTREQLLSSELRYGGKIGIVEMPLYRSLQIDTLDDLLLINSILNKGVLNR
jgi:CMP-N,N'-diacetyllegionaminic acid synthase